MCDVDKINNKLLDSLSKILNLPPNIISINIQAGVGVAPTILIERYIKKEDLKSELVTEEYKIVPLDKI